MLHLLAHGLKHTVPPPRYTSTATISTELSQFIERLKWNYYYKDSPPLDPTRRCLLPPRSNAPFRTNDPDYVMPANFDTYHALVRNDLGLNNIPPNSSAAKAPPPYASLSSHAYTHRDLRTVRDFAKNNGLIVKPCDKNLGPSVVTIAQYKRMLISHLQDNRAYTRVASFPGAEMIEKLRTFLKPIENGGLDLADDEKRYIKHAINIWKQHQRVPLFYVIVKLHKGYHSFISRPIVDGKLGILSYVSRIIQVVVRPWIKPDIALKDTTSLINRIENTPLPTDCVLLSFDIISLYTRINKRLLREVFVHYAMRDPDLLASEPRRYAYYTLLDFILTYTIFQSEDEYWKQLQGLFMGDPAAQDLAVLYLQYYEETVILPKAASAHCSPLLYARYADDVFAVLPAGNLHTLFLRLWKQHSPDGIDFDAPTISTSSLAVLDIEMYKGPRFRTTGILDIRSHSKQHNLFLYIPFSSYHPIATLIGWIKAETLRHCRNNSSIEMYLSELRIFHANLTARGYPHQVITRVFRSVSHARRTTYLAQRPPSDRPRMPVLVTEYNYVHSKQQLAKALKRCWSTVSDLLPDHSPPVVAYSQPSTAIGRMLKHSRTPTTN
jgi:hypothetical protein